MPPVAPIARKVEATVDALPLEQARGKAREHPALVWAEFGDDGVKVAHGITKPIMRPSAKDGVCPICASTGVIRPSARSF